MARQLLIEYPNAFYHVMSRGNNRQDLFVDENDFETFLIICKKAKKKFELIIHCFCLMQNHYHLFVQTQKPNLSKAMKFINENYAMYFLRKYSKFDPFLNSRGRLILGRESFARNLIKDSLINLSKDKMDEISCIKELESLLFKRQIDENQLVAEIQKLNLKEKLQKQIRAFFLREYCNYTLKNIGQKIQMKPKSVSRSIKLFREKITKDPEIFNLIFERLKIKS